MRNRALECERQSSEVAESERWIGRESERTEQLRESMRERKKERGLELGSARVLELGFNKITILPLKMLKLTKTGFFMFRSVFKYWPVQPILVGMAGMRRVWLVFLSVRNVGLNRTGLPAGTVYSGCTGRYGAVLTTLLWTLAF